MRGHYIHNMIKELYNIQKHEIRNAADLRLITHYPGARANLTNKLIKETLIYLQGYAKAIDYFAQDPIVIDEMRSLLISEGVDYIVGQIG